MAAKWPHLWRPRVPNDARRDRSEDARLVRKGDENAGPASCAQQETPPQNAMKIEYTYVLFAALHAACSR